MSIVIPSGFANMVMAITNTNGGLSSRNSISLGISLIGGFTTSDAARIGALNNAWLATLWDNGWTVGGTKFLVGPEPLDVFEYSTAIAGTASAAVYASPAVAMVVTKRTIKAGRTYRGRFYLPGVVETLVDEGGVLNSTYLNDVQVTLDAWATALRADAAIDELVLFRDDASPPRIPEDITRLLARTPAATMRPRQRR